MNNFNIDKKYKHFQNSYSWLIVRKAIFFYITTDILCIFIAGFITNYIYKSHIITNQEMIILMIFWTSLSYISGRYSREYNSNFNLKFKELVSKQIKYFFIFYIISWIINNRISANYYFSYDTNFIYILLFFSINSIFFQILNYKLIKRFKNQNKWFFIGNDSDYESLKNLVFRKNIKSSYTIEKFNLNNNLDNNCTGYILTNNYLSDGDERSFMSNILNKDIVIYFLDDWLELRLNRIPFEYINIENLFKNFNRTKNNKLQIRLKRLGDIVLSIILLVLTSPFLLLASILIWISDKGPILYTQVRVGKDGKEFNIYKLRTMIVNAEEGKPSWASKKDKRITLIGQILRRTRLDEIPQLICVLNGDMTLIGPRPERPEIEIELKSQIYNYELRHLVKPGLSGWAQVNSNYAASLEGVKLKLSYDLYYISNQSIWIDFLILIKTIKVVLNFQGSEPV
tara:strand:- start:2210 stop:3577 length:1368 start_codon:yes stop_codon:yes gene_type:complete